MNNLSPLLMDSSHGRENFKTLLIGGLLIFLVGGWFIYRTLHNAQTEKPSLTSPPSDTVNKNTDTFPTIGATAVRQKMANGEHVTFLDLRSPENFSNEHIPASLSLSLNALDSFAIRENELLVVVLSNKDTQGRETVTNILKQKSFPAFLLDGGFEDWKKSGGQTISVGDPNSFLDQSKITYISLTDTLKAINSVENAPFILDVQRRQDYQAKHIKGATNIPLSELEKRTKEIPVSKSIIVYGDAQLTSFQGGVRLADLSFYSTKTLSSPDTLKPVSGLPLEP